jgi:hypothetical protein
MMFLQLFCGLVIRRLDWYLLSVTLIATTRVVQDVYKAVSRLLVYPGEGVAPSCDLKLCGSLCMERPHV